MVLSTESMTGAGDQPRVCRPADLLGDWEAEARAAHEAMTTGQPRGPVTGLATLDRELGGALVPGLHVLHAGPGVGKTAFALQVAATCGFPAVFVTCEMSPLELLRRHTARVTGTFLGRLKSGELAPEESLAKAVEAAAAAPGLAIADATQAFAPAEWLRDVALQARGGGGGLLLIVDSVHSWADASPEEATEYDRLNSALGSLRVLAQQLSCPVLAVAERNRASMSRGGLSASAGTRKFEFGAETVLEMDRSEKAVVDGAGEVPVTLCVTKNRNGAPGRKIELRFHGALQRFREAR